MSTYRRRGHWRRGKNGQRHWVSTHAVTRNGSSAWVRPPSRARKAPLFTAPSSKRAVLWSQVPSEPNANCPVCGARVYFFRNKRGGCAYFDSIGVPWPKHPCIPVFRFDEDAVRQAKLAFESAQKAAEAPAREFPLAGERRAAWQAGRATGRSELHARLANAKADPSLAGIWDAPKPQRVSIPTQRTIGWWSVMAMLLAWFTSLPLSIAYLNEPNDSLWWADHLLVTMPTVVSFPAMAWFLWKVPAPKPSVGRVLRTIVLTPVLLTVGVLSFLFTVGIGSFVFAWILWRQTQIASTAKGMATA